MIDSQFETDISERIVRPMTSKESEVSQYDTSTPQNRLVGYIIRGIINQQRYVEALETCGIYDQTRIYSLIDSGEIFTREMCNLYKELYGDQVNTSDAYSTAGSALLELCDKEPDEIAPDLSGYTELIANPGRIFVPHAGLGQDWLTCKGLDKSDFNC